MITWPCLFKLAGDDEMIYLETEQCLAKELESLIFSDEDFLINTNGEMFMIAFDSEKHIHYQQHHETLSLEAITELIRAHEMSKAEVCLTKIYFHCISDAIHSLANRA